MSTKNIYLFKVSIRDTQTNTEVPVQLFRGLLREIFDREGRNNALKLTYEDTEPMMLDILENTEEYLFARLNRKRPNNSMQKRNYNTYETADVLPPDEIGNNGVEWFTYCILGYSHGILSLVNSKGAPNEGALARVFSRYNNRFSLETETSLDKGIQGKEAKKVLPTLHKTPPNGTIGGVFVCGGKSLNPGPRGYAAPIVTRRYLQAWQTKPRPTPRRKRRAALPLPRRSRRDRQ